MEDPTRAFEHLCRYPLSDLLQMGTAKFWPVAPPFTVTGEDAAERSFELYWHTAQILKADEHDRALMAPKLNAKSRAMTTQSGPEAMFKIRAVAAQIGWIEISLSAQAIRAVEDLLSAGHTESSVAIYHPVEGVRGVQAWPACHVGDAGRANLCSHVHLSDRPLSPVVMSVMSVCRGQSRSRTEAPPLLFLETKRSKKPFRVPNEIQKPLMRFVRRDVRDHIVS
jgi:hypothetical protein